MGRVKEQVFQEDNTFGILDHNGVIKVAKTEIRATILHINTDKNGGVIDVLVKGRKGSYHASIHKGIRKMMCFVEVGDCAFIKWKMGKAWFVGFQKQKAYQNEKIQDRYMDENGNCDWNEFMMGVDVE
jgi:hypothetical protein